MTDRPRKWQHKGEKQKNGSMHHQTQRFISIRKNIKKIKMSEYSLQGE